MSDDTPQIGWFKRNLRVVDHAPLSEAAGHGPVLPLFVVEPSVVEAPDFSAAHLGFAREPLLKLQAALAALGSVLVILCGEMPDVLASIQDAVGAFALWSHEETGNAVTFARDRRVAA